MDTVTIFGTPVEIPRYVGEGEVITPILGDAANLTAWVAEQEAHALSTDEGRQRATEWLNSLTAPADDAARERFDAQVAALRARITAAAGTASRSPRPSRAAAPAEPAAPPADTQEG